MPNSTDPLAFYRVARNLLECASEALQNTQGGTPDRRCVITGQIAWDDCECGQLIVSLQRTFNSSNFPTQGNTAPASPGDRGCGPPITVGEYFVSMLRCSPTGQDQHPPLCSELDEAAQIAIEDAWAIKWGLHCCLNDWTKTQDQSIKIQDFTFLGQQFTGPAGGCQGSLLTLQVGLINACPPCDQFGES